MASSRSQPAGASDVRQGVYGKDGTDELVVDSRDDYQTDQLLYPQNSTLVPALGHRARFI